MCSCSKPNPLSCTTTAGPFGSHPPPISVPRKPGSCMPQAPSLVFFGLLPCKLTSLKSGGSQRQRLSRWTGSGHPVPHPPTHPAAPCLPNPYRTLPRFLLSSGTSISAGLGEKAGTQCLGVPAWVQSLTSRMLGGSWNRDEESKQRKTRWGEVGWRSAQAQTSWKGSNFHLGLGSASPAPHPTP